MKISNLKYILALLLPIVLCSSCKEDSAIEETAPLSDDQNVIHIGGIESDVVETALIGFDTRATRSDGDDDIPSVDAETVEWLLGPLFGGLDITYGAKDQPSTKKVAKLRLLRADGKTGNGFEDIKYSGYVGPNGEKIAEYSFKYLEDDGTEGDDAKWYDNGLHFFQGVFVPEKLRYSADNEEPSAVNDPETGKAPSLMVDQSKNEVEDNYTLLERYLGMPADAYIHATVGRIKLPFRHRLSRVLAYVLIDPIMGPEVTIKGFKKADDGVTDVETEDPANSAIRFCNVKVLSGVKETSNVGGIDGHAELTPQWEKSRKVIPHFVGERTSINSKEVVTDVDNFIMFYNTDTKLYIFPSDDADWAEANTAWNTEYVKALGDGTSADERRVAANEADRLSGYKRTLYGKVPCYDLIVRPTYTSEEKVMYDEDLTGTSKAELVEMNNSIDFEVTLNNGLQYDKSVPFDLDANYQTFVYLRINRDSISFNSSGAEIWKEEAHSDGYYGINNQNGNTLSFAGSSWQRAYRIGSTDPTITDGHYYGKDDTTDADDVQDDDIMPNYPQYVSDESKWIEMFAEAYEGGLHHGDYFILDHDITIDAKKLPANFVFTGHLDGQDHTITLVNAGQSWEEPNYIVSNDYGASMLYVLKGADYIEFHLPEQLYICTSGEGEDPVYVSASPSLADVKSGTTTYYVKDSDENYSPYEVPTTFYENHPITQTSGNTLFAGLNGAYDAAVGVANVHEEKGIKVPYVDADTKTGWRAEVINVIVSGADMFPSDAITTGLYDATKVSGYVYNCWKESAPKPTPIKNHTPTRPKYN